MIEVLLGLILAISFLLVLLSRVKRCTAPRRGVSEKRTDELIVVVLPIVNKSD